MTTAAESVPLGVRHRLAREAFVSKGGRRRSRNEDAARLRMSVQRLAVLEDGLDEPTADEAAALAANIEALVPGGRFWRHRAAPGTLTTEQRAAAVRAALARVGVDLDTIPALAP